MRRVGAAGWAATAGAVALIGAGLAAGTGPVVGSRPSTSLTFPPTPGHGSPAVTAPHPAARPQPGAAGAAAAAHTMDVVMAVVAAVAAAVIVALVVRALMRRAAQVGWGVVPGNPVAAGDGTARTGGPVPAPGVGELLTGVARAEEKLDDERDPRQAVLGCWLRLEEVVARSGAARGPAETPGELVGRVMGSQEVDGPALEALHGLYRRARYSLEPVPASARDQARRALASIRSGLEAAPPAPGPGLEP